MRQRLGIARALLGRPRAAHPRRADERPRPGGHPRVAPPRSGASSTRAAPCSSPPTCSTRSRRPADQRRDRRPRPDRRARPRGGDRLGRRADAPARGGRRAAPQGVRSARSPTSGASPTDGAALRVVLTGGFNAAAVNRVLVARRRRRLASRAGPRLARGALPRLTSRLGATDETHLCRDPQAAPPAWPDDLDGR